MNKVVKCMDECIPKTKCERNIQKVHTTLDE